MTYENRNPEACLNEEQVCRIATEALLAVYNSAADLTAEAIIEQTVAALDEDTGCVSRVVRSLFEYKDPYLQESSNPKYKTMFGSVGLWLIEDCFMHHEDSVDDTEIAKRSLSRTIMPLLIESK